MDPRHAAKLGLLLGDPSRILTLPQTVEQLSRDCYWYSPILRKQLDGKVGDLVVQPVNVAEIQAILRYCQLQNIPVTARGAGTGNYGQAVPLRGGVVLDLARMDRTIATDMAKSGRFTVAQIERGIRECSPNVESRKAGHIEGYAKHTAQQAWSAPEVQAHRQKEHQAQRGQEMGR